MRKSEKVSTQFENIIDYLESANIDLQKLPVEFVDQSVVYSIHNKIENLIDELTELHYETCAPMQADEDDRDAEIRVLERRLTELKSMG